MKPIFTVVFLSCISTSAFAQAKVAVASIIRGDVDLMIAGKSSKLKKDDWVNEGSVVKTAEKSFVKLVFIDKSQMNVGPNSEMKIAKFNGDDSGIIDLVKGKVRSQVTKDYLQMKDKDKSKLFIKTPNAVMGIRGTDFMISTNGKNTSAILFEGSVVFAKHEDMKNNSSDSLEDVVNQGVRMHPGEFSVMEQDRSRPTEPAILNIEQREVLEKSSMDGERTPSAAVEPKEEGKPIVPLGLSGSIVSNESSTIKNELKQNEPNSSSRTSSDPEGYVKGDVVKPANGSFVHMDSGTIIPPGPGSVLDKNTNSYIPGPGQGNVNTSGDYNPPKNVEITPDGKIMVSFKDTAGVMKIQEIEKPRPVVVFSGKTLGDMSQAISRNPAMINPAGTMTNDILNKSFAPNGLNDLSNMQRNNSGTVTPYETRMGTKTRTTITGN